MAKGPYIITGILGLIKQGQWLPDLAYCPRILCRTHGLGSLGLLSVCRRENSVGCCKMEGGEVELESRVATGDQQQGVEASIQEEAMGRLLRACLLDVDERNRSRQ